MDNLPFNENFTRSVHPAREGRLRIFFGYCGIRQLSQRMQAIARETYAPFEIASDDDATAFDLDAILQSAPRLLLIHDLSHRNSPLSRHTKRYQDVRELLNAGVNVYAALDVCQLESVSDVVTDITGTAVLDRVPDSLLWSADQVEFVDAPAGEFICASAAPLDAAQLAALSELARRRFAERAEPSLPLQPNAYRVAEHILVCLSSAPSNADVIRTAARMSYAFRSDFTALFVQTSDFAYLSAADRERLDANMRLARQLGARIETMQGSDVPFQIAEYARLSGVSRIVVGHSAAARRHLLGKPSLTDRLISYAPNLDIHIIPDSAERNRESAEPKGRMRVKITPLDLLKTVVVFAAVTGLSLAFYYVGFTEANIILLYILGVLVTAVWTNGRIYSLLSSIASVTLFNYLFTQPRYTLRANDKGYIVTFLVMFLSAFITGTLAVQLKTQLRDSARTAYRTKMLLDMDRLLSQAKTEREIISVTAGQLRKMLRRDVIAFLSEGDHLSAPICFRETPDEAVEALSPKETAAADWVFRNNQHAGATTDTLADAQNLYLAVRVNERVYGVVGIDMTGGKPEYLESSILLSILGECALSLENERNAREKEAAAELAKNEQIRANLLRSISHDLRTPLTSISGNASNLMSNGDSFDAATKQQIYSDIYDDAMWLIGLVENLLVISKMEEGNLHLHITSEVMEDVVAEALKHIDRKAAEHTILTRKSEDVILAKMDAKLVVQVLINLVDNAVKYTPPGSVIRIETERRNGRVLVHVRDNGPGISDAEKPLIFERFYSGANKIADSRRSLGLGLSLCRSIVTALGGSITVTDADPQGADFLFTLPIGEVLLHE